MKIREGNSGIMAVPARLLRKWLGKLKNSNAQGEYYLTDIIAMAVKDKVKVTPLIAPTVAEVLGVNDKVQLAELEALHRAERARELMVAGATLIDPSRIDIRGDVSVGRDVFLDANVLLEGKVTLGDRVRVGPNVVLRDVAIGSDCVIHPNSVLEQSVLGTGCIIGPYARVRPGSKLGANVHIGNFVELKKTEIDDGSKANHLTYLGDAVIGKGVNVGAGTITCNYDGVNKSTTTIEDGAFIGSGNMLVAPVRIGKDATTGAGSTITKDAPDGQLTLTRGEAGDSRRLETPGEKAEVRLPLAVRPSAGTMTAMHPITFAALEAFPRELEKHYAAFPARFVHWAPPSWDGVPSEPFTALEQICHVRDIEIEGYQVRFRRTLDENSPLLPSIDSEAVAKERNYGAADATQSVRGISRGAREHPEHAARPR